VKMLVYLTDVTASDNNFAFVPGSHLGQHRRTSFGESRVSDAEVAKMEVDPVEVFGAAGTAVIFDTNIVHRLRRRMSASTRDTMTFYYTPGQSLRNIRGIAAARARLTRPGAKVLAGRH